MCGNIYSNSPKTFDSSSKEVFMSSPLISPDQLKKIEKKMACEETWHEMSMVWLSVNLICCVNVNVKTTKRAKVDDKAVRPAGEIGWKPISQVSAVSNIPFGEVQCSNYVSRCIRLRIGKKSNGDQGPETDFQLWAALHWLSLNSIPIWVCWNI